MKKDVAASGVIGFLIAALFLAIFQNLKEKLPFALPYPWLALFISPVLSTLGMGVALAIGKRIPVFLQIAKFLLVGALNTFLDLGILNFLIFLVGTSTGLTFSVFKGASFCFAVTNSYLWNKHWTFQAKRPETNQETSKKEFAKFFTVSGVGFILNVGIASFVVNAVGPQFGIAEKVWANIGALVGVFVVMAWDFLGYKLIVFRK